MYTGQSGESAVWSPLQDIHLGVGAGAADVSPMFSACGQTSNLCGPAHCLQTCVEATLRVSASAV